MTHESTRRLLAGISLMVAALVACVTSVPMTAPPTVQATPAPAGPLPFEGLWVSEGTDALRSHQVLAITAHSLYWVQTGNWANIASQEDIQGGAHEEFFEISSYDLHENHITLRKRWVRNDGVFGGFDSPQSLLTYTLNGNELRIAIVGENDFPPEATSEPYYRR